VRNAASAWWQPQQLPWRMPLWLEHRFVALDNTRDFVSQLYATAQCEEDMLFDAVLVRQGLCFCDDPSKTSLAWPSEIYVKRAETHGVCGLYQLEPFLAEGRPAYRKGQYMLQWCPARWEWAVLDAETGGLWPSPEVTSGIPPWHGGRGQCGTAPATSQMHPLVAIWRSRAHHHGRSHHRSVFAVAASPAMR